MGFLDFLMGPDINEGLKEFREREGAVLLDVRSHDEYVLGHVPGSLHIPLDSIERIKAEVPDLSTPIYAYCLSGARSSSAVSRLKAMGYAEVHNIGGINRYRGKPER